MNGGIHNVAAAYGAQTDHGGQTPAERAVGIARQIKDEIGRLEMDRSKRSALTSKVNLVLAGATDDDRFSAALALARLPSCGNPRMKALIADLEECLKQWRPGCEASLPSDATIVEVTDARAPAAVSAEDGGANPDCPKPESQQATAHRQRAWDDERTAERIRAIAGSISDDCGGLGLREADRQEAASRRHRVLNFSCGPGLFDSARILADVLKKGDAKGKQAAANIFEALKGKTPGADDSQEASPERRDEPAEPESPGDQGCGEETQVPAEAAEPRLETERRITPATSAHVLLSDLRVQEPFSTLFPIREAIVEAIAGDMRERGYDNALPIIAWSERGVVVDGHTRLEAARRAGLAEVPVCLKSFGNEDEALAFALHEQRDRRNLQDGDIVRLVETLDEYRARGGDRRSEEARSKTSNDVFGPSSAATAKLIGTSPTKVEKARAVNAAADPSLRERVEAGVLSLNRAASQARAAKRPERRTGIGAAAKRAAKGLRAIAADLRKKNSELLAGLCVQIDTLADAMDAAAEKAADPDTGVAQPVSAEQRLKHTIAENKIRQAQKLCN